MHIQEVDSVCQDGDFPEGMLEEWELFLSKDREPHEIFEFGRIFPLQREAESKKMLAEMNKVKPKTVMEIGADKGGSVWLMCKCIPTVKRVIACEIRGVPYLSLLQKSFPHIEFLGLGESSLTKSCIGKVTNWLGRNEIDCLFIDGDKVWYHIDFNNYVHLMSRNSLAIFHDIQDETTGNSFRRIRALGYDSLEIIDKSDAVVACKREEEGIPPSGSYEGWLRHWQGSSCGVGIIYVK